MKKFSGGIIALALILLGVYVYKNDTLVAETKTVEVGDKSNLIVVTIPEGGRAITSPLTVGGQARGNWYFEGTFPIDVLAADGSVIGKGLATAQGEWMTEEFVPFTGSITSTAPREGMKSGIVLFKKDNPSGLPENEDSLAVPVQFK